MLETFRSDLHVKVDSPSLRMVSWHSLRRLAEWLVPATNDNSMAHLKSCPSLPSAPKIPLYSNYRGEIVSSCSFS